MQRVALIWTLLLALSASCANEPEQVAISASLRDAMTTLVNSDWSGLWAMSDAASRKELMDLSERVQEALVSLNDVYDDEESREKAKDALGEAWIQGIDLSAPDAGPKLLARMLKPEDIHFSERAVDGLRASRAIIDGDRAVIHTLAGEVFTLHRDGDAWRSRLISDLIEQNPDLIKLKESVKAVLDARDAHRRAWEVSRDPRQPQGTYNLVRARLDQKPLDGAALYALLNGNSRKALLDALTTAREAQKLIQADTKRNERTEAYVAHGIALYVNAGSDQELYSAWAQSTSYVSPIKGTALPNLVEPGASEDLATVISKSGEKLLVSRDQDGFWRLDHEGAIRQGLVSPVQKVLKGMNGR